MLGLKFEIEENGSLEEELKAFTTKVDAQVPKALKIVGDQMSVALAESIDKNVYDAYVPKMYPRRDDNPQFGESIFQQALNAQPTVSGNVLTFTYNPHGTHDGLMQDIPGYWDMEDPPKPDLLIKPFPVHGDDLIRRLETGKGYDWKPKEPIPPRPFWTRFVNEQRDDKIIAYFMLGMKPFEVIGEGGEKDVEFDGSEYVPGTTIVLPV